MSNPGGPPGGVPDPLQFWRDLYADPMRPWRDFYQQNEASWGKALEQQMGSEAFAAMIGQTLEAYVSFQKALRESMNRYLETMNLPSRDDFARAAAQIRALEDKIDELDEKLDDLVDRLAEQRDSRDGQPTRQPATARPRRARPARKRA